MMHYLGLSGGGPRLRPSLLVALSILAWFIIGCTEPVNAYRTTESNLASGNKVLVMPFMDARTFTDPKDPYRDSLGEHARDIFVAALKEHPTGYGREILAPAMPKVEGSMTIAEVAEIGREHGADYVVSGQMFSFTETRAASIPPRAGMFIRVVSVKDGSLAFVGDHYQAASVPGASGGRELQAKQVAEKLIENMSANNNTQAFAVNRMIGSGFALASMISGDKRSIKAGDESVLLPEAPPPLPDFFTDGESKPVAKAASVPDVPPVLDYGSGDEFYNFAQNDMSTGNTLAAAPAAATSEKQAAKATVTPVEPPAPALDLAGIGIGVSSDTAPVQPSATTSQTKAVEEVVKASTPAEEKKTVVAAAQTPVAAKTEEVAAAESPAEATNEEVADSDAEDNQSSVADMAEESSPAMPSGDDLAADLFAEEDAWDTAMSAKTTAPAAPVSMPTEEPALASDDDSSYEEYAEYETSDEGDQPGMFMTQRQYFESIGVGFPDEKDAVAQVVATPPSAISPKVSFATEQPTPIYSIDNIEGADESVVRTTNGKSDSLTTVVAPVASGKTVRVLLLPYHDRNNPDNLITQTGGGEVVTALFGSRLATEKDIQILWAGGAEHSHHRLASKEEAIEFGRRAGADYVVRGEVVEFRRAQSVPSFYSVVISTAVLAAQIFFAEISGVDVATEVYRVSDGMCVMSRRDHSQQKYVVQAEKTVRRLAAGMATDVATILRSPMPEAMDPLIDNLSTTSQLASIK